MSHTKPDAGSFSRSREPTTQETTQRTTPGTTRQGAGVFDVDDFVPEQTTAWNQALAIISSCHAGLKARRVHGDESAAAKWFKHYEPARPSQIILFDAGRGAGKSSLLFTLCEQARQAWLDRWCGGRASERRTAEPNRPPPSRDESTPRPNAVPEYCFPLRPLDMHPLPVARPLIAYLFTQFDSLRRELAQVRDGERAAPAWMSHSDDGIISRLDKEWRALAQAALSYGAQASRSLDDDAVSAGIDMIDEARAASSLNEHFYRFIEAMCAALTARFGLTEAPLLLVPIDDADMNLQRSVECIELLRSLYHPQVIFVLTGHSDLFVTQLREHTLERLKHLDPADQQHYARKYAFELYDRVIPPSHRCEIKPLDFAKRLLTQVEIDQKRLSISEVLSGESLPNSQWFGIVPHLLTEEWTDKTPQTLVRRSTKRLAAALPDRLRGMLNLLLALRELPNDLPEARMRINEALTIWEHATHPMLSQDELAALEDVTRWLYPESGDRVELSLARFRWKVEHRQIAALGERTQPRVRFFSSRVDGADLILSGDRVVPLDARQTSALALLVNVVEEVSPNAIVFEDSPLFRNMIPGWFARAEVDTTQGTRAEVPWPIPAWQRLAPASRFNTRWEQLARAGALAEDDTAIRWFVALIILSSLPREMSRPGPWRASKRWPSLSSIEMWESRFRSRGAPSKVPPLTLAPSNEEITEAVLWCMDRQAEHIEQNSDVVALYDWLRLRMALILAPEGGLLDSTIAPIFEVIQRLFPTFEDFGPDLVRARKERLQHMQLAPNLFDRPAAPWTQAVRDVPPFNAERVFDQLNNVAFDRPPVWAARNTLGAYFSAEATPAMLADMPGAVQLALQRFVIDAPTLDDRSRSMRLQAIAVTAASLFGAVTTTERGGNIVLTSADEKVIEVRGFMNATTPLERSSIAGVLPHTRWRLSNAGTGGEAFEFLVTLATDTSADFLNKDLRRSPTPRHLRKWPGWALPLSNTSNADVVTCAFPMPDFPARLDARLLDIAWRNELERSTSAALAFVIAVARVGRREVEVERGAKRRTPHAQVSLRTWREVLAFFFSAEFEKLLSLNGPRAKALAAFRANLPIFAAPERSLAADEVRVLLRECARHHLRWTAQLDELRRDMLHRFEPHVPQLLAQLDDGAPAAWKAFIANAPLPRPTARRTPATRPHPAQKSRAS